VTRGFLVASNSDDEEYRMMLHLSQGGGFVYPNGIARHKSNMAGLSMTNHSRNGSLYFSENGLNKLFTTLKPEEQARTKSLFNALMADRLEKVLAEKPGSTVHMPGVQPLQLKPGIIAVVDKLASMMDIISGKHPENAHIQSSPVNFQYAAGPYHHDAFESQHLKINATQLPDSIEKENPFLISTHVTNHHAFGAFQRVKNGQSPEVPLPEARHNLLSEELEKRVRDDLVLNHKLEEGPGRDVYFSPSFTPQPNNFKY
jgi:hypothetical protein